jgi:hypothetical protein
MSLELRKRIGQTDETKTLFKGEKLLDTNGDIEGATGSGGIGEPLKMERFKKTEVDLPKPKKAYELLQGKKLLN